MVLLGGGQARCEGKSGGGVPWLGGWVTICKLDDECSFKHQQSIYGNFSFFRVIIPWGQYATEKL